MLYVPDLTHRTAPAALPELMDEPCSYEELRACLRDIAKVNRITFAHRPTLSWLSSLMERRPKSSTPLTIVDVGSGYGDSLRHIYHWAKKRGVAVDLTGVDLNGDAVRAAREATPAEMRIRWVHGDAFSYKPEAGIDVVLSSLLTHHLEDEELVRFLAWMEATAQLGWFSNDLHRTAFPYKAFSLLIKVLPFHRFVRNDGLVSIRRSFRLEDWQRLCVAAGLPMTDVVIREYRPARLCVGHIK